MTNDEYQSTQDTIEYIYQTIALFDIDIDGFLTQARRAQGIGPILDPTLYIQASDNLQTIIRMAEAIRPAVKLVREMKGGETHD